MRLKGDRHGQPKPRNAEKTAPVKAELRRLLPKTITAASSTPKLGRPKVLGMTIRQE